MMKDDKPKAILITGLMYTFLILTVVAFLFHLIGLNWFESVLKDVPEVPKWAQEIIKGLLKALELTFVYKMLTRKSFLICMGIAIAETVTVGFIPAGLFQTLADAVIMLVVTLIFRKDRLWSLVDYIFLYALMTVYAILSTLVKFGEFSLTYNYSFYANIVSMLDYKLFVITLYLYTKLKGGIKLWMKNRRLLAPEILPTQEDR